MPVSYPARVPVPPPRRLTTLGQAVAGGALATSAFPDLGWWAAAPVGIGLLYLALRRDSASWNLLVGTLWGVAYFLPMLWWAYTAVGAVPWLALSVAEGLSVGLVGVCWSWARRGEAVWRRPALQVVILPVLWVGAELLRSGWPFGGFPWGRLAFSQADSPLLSLARIGGAPLVSALVVLCGVLLARAWLAVRTGRLPAAFGATLLATLTVASGLAVPLDSAAQAGTLKVGIVQGNVPGQGLDAFGRRAQVLSNHAAGTRALLDEVQPGELDLVVWPENGTDIDPQVDAGAAAVVDDAARAVGAPMLVGTVQYPQTGGRYNTSVLWVPGVGVTATYAKQVPAAFAEYIPLRSIARRFSPAVDLVTQDMLPGDRPGFVPLESARLGRTVGLGDVICFEVAYDRVVREAVTTGGEILVVQTNNATFGWTAESTQQLAMSRFRAVEHGRATVQVSTVGVSAVVAPNGVVTARTGLFTAEQRVATLPLRTSTTPATRYGGLVAWAFGLLAVATTVSGAAGALRTRRPDRTEVL